MGFASISAAQSAAPVPDIVAGSWTIRQDDDFRDGTPRVTAVAMARETLERQKPALFLRCAGKQTSAFLTTSAVLGTPPSVAVTWRADDQAARTERWMLDDLQSGVAAPDAVAFIQALATHRQLALTIAADQKPAIVLTFEISGAETAAASIRKLCEW